jgi:hypothetical protein
MRSIFPSSRLLLVSWGVYSHRLAFYWSVEEYIPTVSPSIGQLRSMFPSSRLLLVSWGVYSHHLALYWSVEEYISIISPSIGQLRIIFPSSRLLLVSWGIYSHILVLYWSLVSAGYTFVISWSDGKEDTDIAFQEYTYSGDVVARHAHVYTNIVSL